MIGRNIVAVTFATWNERTEPSRSTSDRTACFSGTLFLPVSGFAADIGFVDLDHFIRAAHAAGDAALAHRLANTHGHEPCGLVRDAEHAVQLVTGHPLLG